MSYFSLGSLGWPVGIDGDWPALWLFLWQESLSNRGVIFEASTSTPAAKCFCRTGRDLLRKVEEFSRITLRWGACTDRITSFVKPGASKAPPSAFVNPSDARCLRILRFKRDSFGLSWISMFLSLFIMHRTKLGYPNILTSNKQAHRSSCQRRY